MKHFLQLYIISFCLLLPTYADGGLREQDVIASLESTYPPYLAALIEQDLADAKLRQAVGSFDTNLSIKAENRPKNYYDGSNYELLLERPFESIGGSIYGGYRISDGFLPDYKREIRTGDRGEAVFGFNLPLLRDLTFNPRKAQLSTAEINRQLAQPAIALQFIDMMKAARVAYYDWLVRGYALINTKELLDVAEKRQQLFEQEVEQGSQPKIILTDNKRLVIQRTLAYNQAQADYENSTLALSLFHRDPKDKNPIIVEFSEMPSNLPIYPLTTTTQKERDLTNALNSHPTLKRFDLLKRRSEVDLKLARNNKKPDLNLTFELNQSIDNQAPDDIEETEITSLLKFTLPLGRNEAKGREEEALSKLEQLEKERQYAQEVITTDIEVIYNAMQNNHKAYVLAQENEELSQTMLNGEDAMFKEGASDLLKLQIREQDYLSAQLTTLKSLHQYYKSYAKYISATAKDTKRIKKPTRG